MIKRRRTAVLVGFAVAASAFLLPASPASAVTQVNACVNSLITTQASRIPVDQTATASPNPVSPGGAVALSNISSTASIPPGVALTGYRSFVLSAGAFSIPVTTHMVIEGTNTVEGTQTTNTVNATVTGTITDPTPANRNSGDESATVDPLTVSFNDQTWTAGASGLIEFREDTITPLSAIVGDGSGGLILEATIGPIVVNFACSPGEVVEGADPSTIVFTDPAATFASTQIAPLVSNISIGNASATEGGAENFTVSLDTAQAAPVTVDFATADGTAMAPGDYTSTSGTVTFAPGVTTQTVTVPTIDDAVCELTETFNVNLSNATGQAVIVPPGTGTGTILDNDTCVDASGQGGVIVNGPVKTGATTKVYVFKVSNLGTAPITVNSATDITADVLVNGAVNGSVSPITGTKTISPGGSARFRLRWTGGPLVSGDSVEFTACVNLAGDIDPTNNCGSETRLVP